MKIRKIAAVYVGLFIHESHWFIVEEGKKAKCKALGKEA